MKKFVASLSILMLTPVVMFAQKPIQANNDSLKFVVDIPLADAPFNYQQKFYWPSMAQSTAASAGFNEIAFWGIDAGVNKLVKPRRKGLNRLTKFTLNTVFTFGSAFLPLGWAWTHEEYHRAVLWNRQVSSVNDVYSFQGGNTIRVSHVTDAALANMKNRYNADFVRLGAAGIEGQNELILRMQKHDFFYNQQAKKGIFYLLNVYNNYAYLQTASSANASDSLVNSLLREEGTNVDVRDFTGIDFTAWAYDLFRPDEPYEQRGVHPSGVGIDRYIRHADMTQEELTYLHKQKNLSLLSLLDPSLFGFRGFTIHTYKNGDALKMNANVRHYLTSFGHTVNANVFLKKSNFNLFITFLNQKNYRHYFPGLDAQLISYPVRLRSRELFITPRVMAWLQPERQSFTTARAQAGGLIACQLEYPLTRFLRISWEIEGKTPGWVAGNVYLEKNLSTRLGINLYAR